MACECEHFHRHSRLSLFFWLVSEGNLPATCIFCHHLAGGWCTFWLWLKDCWAGSGVGNDPCCQEVFTVCKLLWPRQLTSISLARLASVSPSGVHGTTLVSATVASLSDKWRSCRSVQVCISVSPGAYPARVNWVRPSGWRSVCLILELAQMQRPACLFTQGYRKTSSNVNWTQWAWDLYVTQILCNSGKLSLGASWEWKLKW